MLICPCRRLLLLFFHSLRAGNLVEFRFGDHTAVAIECRSELDRKSLDVEVSVNHAAFLERKRILHENIALDFSPKVDISTDYVALDIGLLTDDHTTLGLYLAFKGSVNADVIRRYDFTLDDGSCRDSADGIQVRRYFR